jgi:drug/metabolite transporter (DMT)-like permease
LSGHDRPCPRPHRAASNDIRPARRAVRVVGYVIPIVFVLLWASGFVVPRAFAPYAEPLGFVAARNAGAAMVLVLVALALRRPWPTAWADRLGLMWAGGLLQGFFLMAGYWAIVGGLSVGVGALIGALQPALTALFAALVAGEGLRRRQWLGLALGFAGVAVVISPKLIGGEGHASLVLTLVFLAGVACAAYASVYQKRFERVGDAVTRTALMFIGAAIPAALGALAFEHGRIAVALPLVAVYLWSVFALAIGATMALLYLIQKGEAAKAASFIYLVPPVSAVMARLGFGEPIGWALIAGFAVTAGGVWLVQARS